MGGKVEVVLGKAWLAWEYARATGEGEKVNV